ncbi:TolC family protein [Sphingomonas sp. LR55]|uniref:TolC family protein n=1 Tax=Sphingomonas sp. LR55 TaxID=3050231 RepID=UPI003FA7BCD8
MKRFAILLLAGVTSACTMGPRNLDAHASLPPTAAAQTFAPSSGAAQATTLAAVPSEWWRTFGSAQLDTLVSEAQAHATDIAVAEATLRQYREQGSATAGSALPQADVNYQAERTRISNALSPAVADQNQQLYTLHTAQVTVSYAPDLFGGTRSKIHSARRDRDAAAAARGGTDDGNRQPGRGGDPARLAGRSDRRRADRDRGQPRHPADTGQAPATRRRRGCRCVDAAGGTRDGRRRTPPLVRAEAHQRVVIGTLIGRSAGSDMPPLPTLASLTLPRDLPLIVPSNLVARRPDVLAARAQLEGAGADVGTAIAARLPAISLSGSAGGTSERFGDMFKSGNPFWTLIGGITQPIFHAGALRHQQHAAEAALDGAKAQYRAAVLQAFGDVSDALTGLRTDADALDSATRATDASGRALDFVRRQLALGDVGTPALLNATATDAQARGQAVQGRAARLADTVALFQAAGGGVTGG